MAVNPVNGAIYVSNLDSRNHVRLFASHGAKPTLISPSQ
jgi:hypothetical protein